MKRIISVLLLMTLLLTALPVCAEQPADGANANQTALRLLTANIWGDYFDNPVELREDAFIDAFAAYQPDVIGMQEVTYNWYHGDLFTALDAEYELIEKFPGMTHNYVPLLYKRDRFTLLESGYHQYTQTDDKSKAYTYAVLETIENGQVLAVINTHFWWKSGGEHDAIRMVNAQELTECMLKLREAYNCPVFAFGDLNCTTYAGPFHLFAEHDIVRLRDVAKSFSKKSSHHGNPVKGEDGLFHGAKPKNPEAKAIDHIIGFRGDYEVTTYQLILDQPVLDASDHSPLYADILLN